MSGGWHVGSVCPGVGLRIICLGFVCSYDVDAFGRVGSGGCACCGLLHGCGYGGSICPGVGLGVKDLDKVA